MKKEKPIIDLKPFEFEVQDRSFENFEDGGYVTIAIYHPESNAVEDTVYIDYIVCVDKQEIDFVWEADGEPTYVPYGNQSVLYDDGSGGPDYAEIGNCCSIDDFEIKDHEYSDLSINKACEKINCSVPDLTNMIEALKPLVIYEMHDYLENYFSDYDNWPEREEDEPDYDPYDWM